MTARTDRPATPSVAEIVETFCAEPLPFQVTAYDGSATGSTESGVRMHLRTPEALRYVLSAPGDLGIARAYLTDQLVLEGVHPGDPHRLFVLLKRQTRLRRPPVRELARLAARLGPGAFNPPPPPDIEMLPRWRRAAESLRGPDGRRQEAISHHYDVSNRFYEMVLGPSMAYTSACFASPEDPLEEAQERKFELVAGKLGLRPGMTLLDVGCGWGSMVRHAARHHGVRALGVTLSAQQAAWAQARIEAEGLSGLAQVRHADYREAPAQAYDAISSIGLTEHIGTRHYPAYFAFLASRLRPGGRLLNHCITRADDRGEVKPEPFTDRYVFPDGEIGRLSQVMSSCYDSGLEVQHSENLRMSYAFTLAQWSANLVANWDACVAEVGLPTARVWGLYMAGSRLMFEANQIQLHQILASAPGADAELLFPLRPDWSADPALPSMAG